MKWTLVLLVMLAVAVQANPTAWQADADSLIMSDPPDDAEIAEGVLELDVDRFSSPGVVGIYLLSEDWDEFSVTWNNQPTYDTEKMLFKDWVYYYGYRFELTLDGSILTEWFQEEPFNNFGMIITSDPYMTWPDMSFKSRETAYEPLLWLYPDPWPVESLSWGVIKATEW